MRSFAFGGALVTALAVAGGAQAALIDFTDSTEFSVGTPSAEVVTAGGVTFDITPTGGDLRFTSYDGNTCDDTTLACDLDGVGITVSDEILGGSGEAITVMARDGVEIDITSLFFLDLFRKPGDSTNFETALVEFFDKDGNAITPASVSIDAGEDLGGGRAGYLQHDLSVTGVNKLVFSGVGKYGDDGSNDYAVAAIAFDVTEVPLPAGAVLIGTAMAALGAFGRRKRAS